MIKENQSRAYYLTMLVFFIIAASVMGMNLILMIMRHEVTLLSSVIGGAACVAFTLYAKDCYKRSNPPHEAPPQALPPNVSPASDLFVCVLAYGLLVLLVAGTIYRYQVINVANLFILFIATLALHFKGREYYKKYQKNKNI